MTGLSKEKKPVYLPSISSSPISASSTVEPVTDSQVKEAITADVRKWQSGSSLEKSYKDGALV
jgi:hypothetical protein